MSLSRILVGVKRVIDYSVKIRIDPKIGVVTQGVKHSINPFDEIALEEALRMKEQKLTQEVVAVSIGVEQCKDTLRTALALGADRAIHILLKPEFYSNLKPLHVAKIFAKLTKKLNADLILFGKQAIDDDCNETAQMTAALLDWPQALYASDIKLVGSKVNVDREIDGGTEKLEIDVPCVISVDLRLNEPRYATLPNIMKAKKKPFETINIEDLEIKHDETLITKSVSDPPQRKAGVKVQDVQQLMDELRKQGFFVK